MEKLRYSNVRESAPLLRSHMEFHSYMCSVMAIFPTRITGLKQGSPWLNTKSYLPYVRKISAPNISSQLISSRKISAKNFDLFRRRKISAKNSREQIKFHKIDVQNFHPHVHFLQYHHYNSFQLRRTFSWIVYNL